MNPNESQNGCCRICSGTVRAFADFGQQPLSDAFRRPEDITPEFTFPLIVGWCSECTMAQLLHEVPRERMFHAEYPYRSSGSRVMVDHFTRLAHRFLAEELSGRDPFLVEIGSNDGVMLRTVAQAGVRHLGVDPSAGVAETAQAAGVRVRKDFFEAAIGKEIAATEGRADVVYAANTICHIPYLDSIFEGLEALLTDRGIFVFEDPYVGDILQRRSFDQIYDEHFYFFGAGSVRSMAARFGFELIDLERLPVHGGEVRYTLARRGRRPVTAAVAELIEEETAQGLNTFDPYRAFGSDVQSVRRQLHTLLADLTAAGHRVAGYGATAKSATVNNYCGIGPELVEVVYDTTPEKQGRVTPGKHIPVEPMAGFHENPPAYALLYAWNHAEEIMANEKAFRESGGKWIRYVPEVMVD